MDRSILVYLLESLRRWKWKVVKFHYLLEWLVDDTKSELSSFVVTTIALFHLPLSPHNSSFENSV